MGIIAGVVHDAQRHTTIVLRTPTNSSKERYSILNTIASFNQHCEVLRGVAKSAEEVISLWSGPPYVNYSVISSRFRVILVWDEKVGEFDISFDVHNALKRLENCVRKEAETLKARSADGVAAVYEAAGHALSAYSHPEVEQGKPSRLSSLSHNNSRRSSLSATPKKKKSLFGRIGSLLKTSPELEQSEGGYGPSAEETRTHVNTGSKLASHAALDDVASDLQLPEAVFKWAHFTPMQSNRKDMQWLTALVQGQNVPEHRPEAPKLRSNVSTPLAFLSPSPSGADEGVISHEPSLGRAGTVVSNAEARSNDVVESTGTLNMSTGIIREAKSSKPGFLPIPQNAGDTSKLDHETNFGSAKGSTGYVNKNSISLGNTAISPQSREAVTKNTASATHSDEAAKTAVGATASSSNASVAISSLQDEVSSAIRARMNSFARLMQEGNFPEALQQIISTQQFLATVNPRRDREILTCSNYYVAVKILHRNSVVEREVSMVVGGSPEAVRLNIECALLTMFLAELRHLLPRHRVAGMQLAVEKNAIVGNFGMCARWLRELVDRAPDRAKAELQGKLNACAAKGDTNKHMPPTNRICYATLQVVTSPYGKCNVCSAVFHGFAAAVSHGQVCGVCYAGAVQRRV